MQWEVAGTDESRGQGRAIVVNADDTAQARRLAMRAGLAVESIRPVGAAAPEAVRTPPATPPVPVPATSAPEPAPQPSQPESPAVAVRDRTTADVKLVETVALVTGWLGLAIGVAGVILIARSACVAQPTAGLTSGLPVVAAGSLQVLAAAVARLLAGVAVSVRDPARAGV